MEKVVIKRSLQEFRERGNPWKNRSYLERLHGMAVICQTHDKNVQTAPGFARVYRIIRQQEFPKLPESTFSHVAECGEIDS